MAAFATFKASLQVKVGSSSAAIRLLGGDKGCCQELACPSIIRSFFVKWHTLKSVKVLDDQGIIVG